MIDPIHEIGFLFDLDGVIIDSESEYSRIWMQLNKEFPTGIENLEEIIKGSTLTQILSDYYETDIVRENVAKRLHEMEDKMKYNYLPYAKEFLQELKKRNFSCALVTSSDNKKMLHLKEELPDIFEFFDYIVTGNKVKTSKPSPEGYLLGAAGIKKSPNRCAVFEDSLQGVKAGFNAGSYVVGVCGTLSAEKLQPYSDILINGFDELILEDLIRILLKR